MEDLARAVLTGVAIGGFCRCSGEGKTCFVIDKLLILTT